MPNEMIPFPEFVRRLTDAGAHDLEDWQLAIVRDWTRPETRNVLASMPRHQGRRQIDRYLDYARRAYEIAFEQNAEHVRIAHTGEARMLDDDEPVQPTPYTTIRVRAPDEIPEWQVQIVQAMMEGRTLIVSRGRAHGLRQLLEWLTDDGLAGDARIFELDIVPENQVMIGDGPDDDIEMVPDFEEQFIETAGILSDAIRRWMLAQIEEQTFQDMMMAAWVGHREPPRQEVPDEITDDDRERWANELETTPYQGNDSGQGVSSDELLEAIGEAVTEWKDVRDEG